MTIVLDFVFLYDMASREIENYTLIIHLLEKKGYTCKLIRNDGAEFFDMIRSRQKARVVIANPLKMDFHCYCYLKIAAQPYKLAGMQWEQIFNNASLGFRKLSKQSINAYHLCWGEAAVDRMHEQGVPMEHLPVTGAISQDYGRALFEDYYKDKSQIAEEFDLDKNKRWVMFVSTLCYAGYSSKEIRNVVKNRGKEYGKFAKMQRKTQAILLKWIRQLLTEYELEFIYRPHPSESISDFVVEMEKEYKSFHVIREYSVKQWAKVCDKVNLWLSTSNAEMFAMGVDYAVVRPVRLDAKFDLPTMRRESFVVSCRDFMKVNMEQDINRSSDIDKRREDDLRYYYSYKKDVPAYRRTAEVLERILVHGRGEKFNFDIRTRLTGWKVLINRYIKSKIENDVIQKKKTDSIHRLPLTKKQKRLILERIRQEEERGHLEYQMSAFISKHESEI